MKNSIRLGTDNDYDLYKEIALENLSETEKLIRKKLNLKEADLKREFNHALSKKGMMFVKEIDNKIVGYLICAFEKKTCYLVDIIIRKKYRRKGYGTQLLNRLKKEIKKTKINNIKLGIRMNNSSINFFKKTGFGIISSDYCEMEKII